MDTAFGDPVEVDPESGAEIYQVVRDPRPTDNIYGEQPFASDDARWLAVQHYGDDARKGAVSVLDLESGDLRQVVETAPAKPCFHAWSRCLYLQKAVGDRRLLQRLPFGASILEDVALVPEVRGTISYGTVSPDHRFFAVAVSVATNVSQVVVMNLSTEESRILVETPAQHFKHEQFSLNGRNQVLIQANSPDVSVVNLGVIDLESGSLNWLPVDAPPPVEVGTWPGGERYTPRCTGHETWIGRTERVFLSTAYDPKKETNIWTAARGSTVARPVCRTPLRFGHVSVSRCGRYWIADAIDELGVPIYGGAFEKGTCRRLAFSRTRHDRRQWSHTHPYLTADNRWLIFTSNRSGYPQVFGARLADNALA